jgi:hypothetical protein
VSTRRTTGIRLQLKAESAAHTETHAKFVECEQEVDSLRKVKAQVDEYRGQCAESAIQVCAGLRAGLSFRQKVQ